MRFTQQTKNKTKKIIPPCGSTERLPYGSREWPVVKGRVARRRAHSQSRASEQSRSTEPSAAPRGPASARRQAPPPRTFGHHATTRARPHPSKALLLEVPKTTKLPVANSIRCLLGGGASHPPLRARRQRAHSGPHPVALHGAAGRVRARRVRGRGGSVVVNCIKITKNRDRCRSLLRPDPSAARDILPREGGLGPIR